MVIYGIHPVEEALRGRRKVHRIWATEKGDWPGKVVRRRAPRRSRSGAGRMRIRASRRWSTRTRTRTRPTSSR